MTLDFPITDVSQIVDHVNDPAGKFRDLDGELLRHAGRTEEFEQMARRLLFMAKDEKERKEVVVDARNMADAMDLK